MKFSIGCCKVTVGFWFAAVLCLCLLLDKSGMTAVGLLAVAVHESGHLLCMRWVQIPVNEMRFGLFDIKIVRGKHRGYWQELAVALAGPAANLICAGLLYLVPAWHGVAVWANLLLALFNLMPVTSLDGGQAVYNLLCMGLSEEQAQGIGLVLSLLVLFPMAIWGFLILLQTKYNFTLLFVSCYLMMCLLLKIDQD